MARSLEVADVPALLEAMVGWLDPAADARESALQHHLHAAQGALRRHWPEYLMEAAGLGLFMVSAGLFGTLLFHPGS
jgi:hypothetical protein